MKEMTLNPLPVLTWNWLRMNTAVFSEEAEFATKPATLETSALPEGATFISGAASQAQEAAAPNGAQIPGAMGKDFDALLEQNAAPTATLELQKGFCTCSG